MKLFKVLQTNQSYTTLSEALREAIIAGALEIITLNKEENNTRRYSMSKSAPPIDYLWSHTELGEQDGDGVVSYKNQDAQRKFRQIRREWLSDFELKISEVSENGYRYWKWFDQEGNLKWWERRPWKEETLHEPGFWK